MGLLSLHLYVSLVAETIPEQLTWWQAKRQTDVVSVFATTMPTKFMTICTISLHTLMGNMGCNQRYTNVWNTSNHQCHLLIKRPQVLFYTWDEILVIMLRGKTVFVCPAWTTGLNENQNRLAIDPGCLGVFMCTFYEPSSYNFLKMTLTIMSR